jgi:hypothetical protein
VVDRERGVYIPVGRIPERVLRILWPGLRFKDAEVWVNLMALRRHLQSRDFYIERVAALNRHETTLLDCMAHAVAYVKWEKVGPGEAGVNIITGLQGGDEHERYLLIGVRMKASECGAAALNHVATVYPVTERKLRTLLGRHEHVLVECGDDLDSGG